MARRLHEPDEFYSDQEDELAMVYVHMIYDTTKIGIDTVLGMAQQSSNDSYRNLVDDPVFTPEGLLLDMGADGPALHAVLAIRHPTFKKPVFFIAADRGEMIQYFDIQFSQKRAYIRWDPFALAMDKNYPVVYQSDYRSPPSLSELLRTEKLWLYQAAEAVDKTLLEQEDQVDMMLNGLGIKPEVFYGPEREVFIHAVKLGMGLTFLPPNIT